jgi:hypothetical protein
MAGPRTHVEMGAFLWEQSLLAGQNVPPGLSALGQSPANRSAFYCGCMFPDWGYDGIDDDAAEDSHWSPFQEAFMAFLKQRAAFPWDAEAQRLIAFCLGVIVHGITDDLWHFSREDHRCFLDVAKARDGADHGPCEVACEVFTHIQCTRRPMRGQFWWPLDVARDVYAERGISVTLAQLAAGCRKLEGEWRKGARWSWLAYPYYRAKYPWCHAHYRGDQYGGIAHGAAASVPYVQQAYAQLASR